MQFPKKLGHLLVKYGKLHCLKNPRSRAGSQSFCRLRYQKHMMRYGAIRFFSTYSRHHLLGVGPSCMSVKGPVRMVETLCGEKGTSALFVSGSEQRTSEVDIDLDLAQQMASVDELKKNVRLRGLEMDVDALAEKYRGYQRLQTVKLKLEEERTDIAKRMAALVKVKQTEDITNSREVLMKRGKEIKVELRDLMTEWWQIEEEVMFTALKLPNDLHSDSPEDAMEVLDEMNQTAKPDGKIRHWDVGRERDWIKFSNVGSRAFYLKGELALLEQSLISFVSKMLEERGFFQLTCPEFLRSLVVEGCGGDFTDPDQIYRLQSGAGDSSSEMRHTKPGYHLRGLSPLSFAAYLTKMNIDVTTLPQNYFAVGRSYVPVKSSQVERLPGLYGALQSVKAQICGVCRDEEESWQTFQSFCSLLLELYGGLKLPLRVVRLPASALHTSEQLRHNLQIWAPAVSDYITVASVSLIGDYISRRLMIQYSTDTGTIKHGHFVQMVHAEVMDVTKLIAVLVEYGSIIDQFFQMPDIATLRGYLF